MPTLTTIGFDADDTLWHNERFFQLTEARFREMLSDHADADLVSSRLLEAERRNLGHYGFGIKGFVLSMIETALDVTGDTAAPAIVRQILDAGREMLEHPVEALPEAQETLAALAGAYKLVLITKGDLFDQERKLAASGLGDYFDAVEIVSDKTAATYERLFARHGDGPARAMMVGNSLKSDVLPALAAGSFGVHIPHELTWALEHAERPRNAPRFRQVDRLGEVRTILAEIG
ncbi:HAD family hydrolase [Aurantimonas sp. DM33-3]|uniref:HAD family hydrolase n=1 Tax=Aurantimonas sp. DM33-3 TaxID=2766955 RepID=UPI001652132A|nr:HAD family hydrolase [Aurantimonas sp. DM33-3]MBC6717405.1 HAD family hydrolase [Aurantimonas sp. DM33-3]